MSNLSFNKQPAVWLGLVGAIIALAVSFGLNLTSNQIGSIMAVVSIVLSIITNTQVTPTSQIPPTPGK